MQVPVFTFSDELRDAMDAVIRDLPSYDKAEEEQASHHVPVTPERMKKLYADVAKNKIKNTATFPTGPWTEECQAALKDKFWTHCEDLPESMQKELAELDQLLIGVVSGYGALALRMKNLPEGMSGILAVGGLLRVAVNAGADTQSVIGEVCHDPERMRVRAQNAIAHRDGKTYSDRIDSLTGVRVGEVAVTTPIISLDEFIDEVARAYRKRCHGTPLSEPLDTELRQEVCRLMAQPVYRRESKTDHSRRPKLSPPEPLLLPLSDPELPNQPWRFHPHFLIDEKWVEGSGDIQFKRIAWAVSDARRTLKELPAEVIHPCEALIYNNTLVAHSVGVVVQDIKSQPGEPRYLVAQDVKLPPPKDPSRSGFHVVAGMLPRDYWRNLSRQQPSASGAEKTH